MRFEKTLGTQESITSEVGILSERHIGGYVFDTADLDAHFVVELLLDGFPTQISRAILFDHELWEAGRGDGCYRFDFVLENDALDATQIVEVRLANTNRSLGPPIVVSAIIGKDEREPRGGVSWLGGLRFVGWFGEDRKDGENHRVKAFIDAVLVAEAPATFWTTAEDKGSGKPVPAFDLHLPARFGDGRVRRLQVVDDAGREMIGSPCAFVAFEGGLTGFLNEVAGVESERLRGELFDRLIPQSLPFVSFNEWMAAFPPPASQCRAPAIAVVLIGETDLAASVRSLGAQIGCRWTGGALPERTAQGTFRLEDLQQFLAGDAADCEIIVFALCGTVFHPHALARLANALDDFPAAAIAYSDVAILGDDDKAWPIAFPAFDYERMLEQGYGAYCFAARATYAREALANGASDLFRFFNMSVDGRTMAVLSGNRPDVCAQPVHAPGFLAKIPRPDMRDCPMRLTKATQAHLETRGIPAACSPAFGALFPAVRVLRRTRAKSVSIVIPARDRGDLLEPCLESLRATTGAHRVEIIVVTNDSSNPNTLGYLTKMVDEIRVVNVSGSFNFPKIAWSGAAVATGELLLCMSEDLEVLSVDWLDEMLSRIVDPEVGAVGATLLRPNQIIEDSGIVLGPGFSARPAFTERKDGDAGYSDLLLVAHQCSAVRASCLLTPRRLFMELAGFDGDRFPVYFNDVDYCLRLRSRGYRIITTPYAKFSYQAPGPRGRNAAIDSIDRMHFELRNLRSAWGEALQNDPYYNSMLSLDELPFTALAWPPRSFEPRQPFQAPARPVPPGL